MDFLGKMSGTGILMENDNKSKENIARIAAVPVILLTSMTFHDIIKYSNSILQKCGMGVVN